MMALFKRKDEPAHKHEHKKSGAKLKIAALAVIAIAAAAFYALFVLQVNETVVSSPAVVNITRSGGLYKIGSDQYLVSLAYISLNNGRAYIHITKLPVFVNPLLNVTLTLNNITKINAGTNFSNIGIQLESISSNSITVKISPLFTSLQIAPDYGSIRAIQGSLYSLNTAGPGGTTKGSGTTITTTTATTALTTAATTVVQTNATAAAIATALRQDSLYGLALNFSTLYANTAGCTANLYNSTYISYHGSAPKGQNTYQNVSRFVPYNMSSSAASAGNGNYNVVFRTKTVDKYFNNTAALAIKVNVSAKAVLNNTLSGVFLDLNYNQLLTNYNRAIGIGGACGVEIP